MTLAEACSVSKRLASTSFRRQLRGNVLVQQWRGSSGNVRLSHHKFLVLHSCSLHKVFFLKFCTIVYILLHVCYFHALSIVILCMACDMI